MGHCQIPIERVINYHFTWHTRHLSYEYIARFPSPPFESSASFLVSIAESFLGWRLQFKEWQSKGRTTKANNCSEAKLRTETIKIGTTVIGRPSSFYLKTKTVKNLQQKKKSSLKWIPPAFFWPQTDKGKVDDMAAATRERSSLHHITLAKPICYLMPGK